MPSNKLLLGLASAIEKTNERISRIKNKKLETAQALKLCIILFIAILLISLAVRLSIPQAPAVIV